MGMVMDTSKLPHPPWRIPFIGDFIGTNLRRPTPAQDTMRLGKGLGPIFTRKFFNSRIVVACGSELIRELADEKRFAKYIGVGVSELRPITGDGLLTAYNDEPNWQRAHDILMPAFSQKAMQGYHPAMLDVAHQLTRSWDRHVGNAPVDVVEDMMKISLETIGRTGFGYPFGSFERDEPHPFLSAMARALAYAQQQFLSPPIIGPLLQRKAARQNKIDVATMNALVDEVIAERAASGTTDTTDLLGMMLTTTHPKTGERLDPVNIRYQVLTFLIAGSDTTSGAMAFALYYLSQNPAVLAQAQAEVDEIWGDDPNPEPTFQQVSKLRYLRRVIDESLRLWPTAPAYFREAREDTVLGGTYAMRKGDMVVVPLLMVHRDPEVWGPNPDVFDPDRFAPGRAKERPAHMYRPFGTGERACIGRQFAIYRASLMLGMLLHRYDMRPDPSYQLRVSEGITLKPDGFTLSLRSRKKGPTTRETTADAPAGAEKCPFNHLNSFG
jgi:cytochrome P450